jgi:RHS repeat-associated protein
MCHLDRTIQAPGRAEEAVTEYGYDCDGNLEKVWDPNHPSASFPLQPSTAYVYDPIQRMTSTSQPWGGAGGGSVTTSYAYDVQDHLVSVTDGEGTVTGYVYSDRDLMTSQASEVSGTTSYVYNDHGEMSSETDARAVTTSRTIDAADRVTFVDSPGTTLDVTYTWGTSAPAFNLGRLQSITRNGGTIGYTYDRFGRTLADGALTYTRDNNGNPLTITYPGSPALQAIYTYDRMDRPISLQSKEGTSAAVFVVKNSPAATYKPFGPLATLVFNSTTNRTETRAWDFRYAPQSITLSGSIFTWSYATDDVGNVTQEQRTLPTPVETRTFGYQDWQYFLACAAGPWNAVSSTCNPPTGQPLEWSYDKVGNRLTEARAGLTDTYDYLPNAGATGNTAELDLVNLGGGGTRDYTFDAGGFLDSVVAGANTIDFAFDDAGQLGQVQRPAASETLTLTYDGRGFLANASDAVTGGYVKPTYSSEGQLLSLERLPATGGTVARHHVLYFAGRPVLLWKKIGAQAATIQYVTTDHLGTPLATLLNTGAVTWSGGTEPFGRDFQEGGASDMLTKDIPLRLPGQWDDALFGGATLGADVYYNVHRWYEWLAGRYSSTDHLGLLASPNLFAYVDARPTHFVDPLGLELMTPILLPPVGCFCAIEAFARTYGEMRSASWKNSDHYFHCKANCEATRCGAEGESCACIISDLREWWDRRAKGDSEAESASDQFANRVGRSFARANPKNSCNVNCSAFRPRNLPSEF